MTAAPALVLGFALTIGVTAVAEAVPAPPPLDTTNVLLGIVIALISWNLRETYGLNGRANRNESQLGDHERRLERLEHDKENP